MATGFQAHCEKWKDCRLCGLCNGRTKVVLARGKLPCAVLFCGEGPGESENILGVPFVGPAGKLLDRIIARAMNNGSNSFPVWTHAFTNLVSCIPRDPNTGGKASEPLPEEIRACMPRLLEMIDLANPKLIVAVGGLARDWFDTSRRDHIPMPRVIPVVGIIHPAAILRSNLAQREFLVQRASVIVENAVDLHLGKGESS